MDYRLSPSEARELIRLKLSHNFGVTPAEATHEHFYKAIVLIVRDLLQRGRSEFMQKAAVQDMAVFCISN